MNAEGSSQYAAVRQGLGILDLTRRSKLLVEGPDRVGFLHSMITNDVQKLDEFQGCYAAFLTPRGKLVADFFVYKFPDFLLLDIDGPLLGKLVQALEKLIVMDDVSLREDTARWDHLSVQGPKSLEIVQEVLGVSAPDDNLRAVALPGEQGWLIRKNDLSPVGLELLVAPGNEGTLKRRLITQAAGRCPAAEVGPEIRNTLRVECAIPEFGQDMDATNYPMEARLQGAISFTKGCYVGQEVVAKATYVGGVGRLLMGLKIAGETTPLEGAEVTKESGELVGHLTSAVWSPSAGQPIALGYVKRTDAKAGTGLLVRLPNGTKASAEVVEDFD